MWSSLYYGNWEYWLNYHKVTFDGVNKLILINNGVTDIDVQIDIYSSWKEWALQSENLKYLKALNIVGGEPTVGAEKLDSTYFLINGWRIKPYPGSYTLNIVGNLFEVNGGSIKVDSDVSPYFSNNITLNLNTSVIVRRIETTVTGSWVLDSSTVVTASLVPSQSVALYDIQTTTDALSLDFQSTKYQGEIIFSNSGGAGSIYPLGTTESPSNNITDILILCALYGIDNIILNDNLTLNSSHDISNLTFIGKNKNIILTLDSPTTNNTQFKNLTLTGTLPE